MTTTSVLERQLD